ncbi:MoxR family ATPase [uncultured Tolumonas sp.]|uniref:AAA family ATPase n=1 Tax=uncultured Tolumonas sp. TaxID=263765 RepID=UPI002930725A|nr:MoxR family ATPase [uncultured Tolumonas sp.]
MQQRIQAVLSELNRVILGKEEEIQLAVCCLLAKGHLLIEDLPGMGKTTLAHALATVMGLDYQRVQFTSDMLPADLLGVSVFEQQKEFVFHPGPVFTQVLLADEINRGSPRTQSALLEAMAERQVSLDGETRALPEPFFVIATQNPQDQAGTYPLPESQLDRFLMRIELGYPDKITEKRMLLQNDSTKVTPLLDAQQLQLMQRQAEQVKVADAALDYLLSLVQESRTAGITPHALSPRASKALLSAARVWAYMAGRDYLLPDDIQAIFAPVAEHRLRSGYSGAIGGQSSLSRALLERVDPVR